MKKISIIGLSVLLAACSSSGNYTTDVSSESYREEYKPQVVAQTMPTETAMNETVVQAPAQMSNNTQIVPQAQSARTNMVQLTPASQAQNKRVRIIAPEPKHKQKVQRFGYTIQVIAVDSSSKASTLANQLPAGTPVWEHYKQVNGTNWYALLYGDYETKSEAKAAIRTLPDYFQSLKPFVKSIDDVKNSAYPKLRKLR